MGGMLCDEGWNREMIIGKTAAASQDLHLVQQQQREGMRLWKNTLKIHMQGVVSHPTQMLSLSIQQKEEED